MLKHKIVSLAALTLIIQSSPAWAEREFHHGYQNNRHSRQYGRVLHHIPRDYRTIRIGRDPYIYSDGFFYRHSPAGYILVVAPRGAVVPVLPRGHRTVIIQSTPYYVYEETYYVQGPGGYVVAEPPPAATQVVETQIPVKVENKESIQEYEVHIPNANGSYTLVVLKKTEKGFVGPQGEIYPEHPTVEQLKDMYAKK